MQNSLFRKAAIPLAFVLLGMVLSNRAHSEEWEFEAGMAVFSFDNPWQEVDSNSGIVPIFSASYGDWSFFDDGIVNYQLLGNDNIGIKLGLDYRNDTYDADGYFGSETSNALVFEGYQALDGDVTFTIDSHWKMFYMGLEQDISGNSKGLTANAGIKYPIYQSKTGFRLVANANVEWMSSNYVNYVYGIRGDQIDESKGRFAYQPGSSLNYLLGLTAQFELNKNWNMFGTYHYKFLDSNIEDSPLVETDNTSGLMVGAVYRF